MFRFSHERTRESLQDKGSGMKRLLIYSHDTFGLGNIRRIMNIDGCLQLTVVIPTYLGGGTIPLWYC